MNRLPLLRPTALSLPFLLSLLVGTLAGCGDDGGSGQVCGDPTPEPLADSTHPPEDGDRCDNHLANRQPLFGETHIHTTLSLDANVQGTRLRPADAYRFAKGEEVGLHPYGEGCEPLRLAQIDEPLDWVLVSDHAEFLGEVQVCTVPGYPGYDSDTCKLYRNDPDAAFFDLNIHLAAFGGVAERPDFCGEDDADCLEAALGPWREIQDAAETAYDRSPTCGFTSFVGYEWSGSPNSVNYHRNVIFANEHVPDLPQSFLDDPHHEALWDALEDECINTMTGCDALAIPHNSNISNGLLFELEQRDGSPFDAAYTARRNRLEPLMEVYQHKGDSECLPDERVDIVSTDGVTGSPGTDPACAFEKLPYNNLSGEIVQLWNPPPPSDFLRTVLGEGMREAARVGGINPFQFGVVAATDTHLGTPGFVAESTHPGHGGAGPSVREALPLGLTDSPRYSPGGLSVVWAEENSRASIFASLRRRETYGTSGTRIVLRFFGGWDEEGMDSVDPAQVDWETGAYASGVPMGSRMNALTMTPAQGPLFVISAMKAAGNATQPGVDLQVVQVIKGWVDDMNELRYAVYDVAGDASNGASVDLTDCSISPVAGGAQAAIDSVWRDPAFDPTRPAYYYVRVLENPTCRWVTQQCVAASITCSGDEADQGQEWNGCCDPTLPRTLQERAWSSPIWYEPAAP